VSLPTRFNSDRTGAQKVNAKQKTLVLSFNSQLYLFSFAHKFSQNEIPAYHNFRVDFIEFHNLSKE
jgi:hypothetical protein